jgi:hypothetical protein
MGIKASDDSGLRWNVWHDLDSMIERGERKQAADDVSKTDQVSKPRVGQFFGIILGDTCHPMTSATVWVGDEAGRDALSTAR